MLSLQHCRYFLWIVETGSFRAAAERAHRSQPAVSLAVREMEARLGQPLFERSSPVQPTAFGRACLPMVRRLVEHADSVEGQLAGMASSNAGQLRVASIMAFATHWMPQLLERFRHLSPGVRLHVYDDSSEGVERLLLDGQVELGICSEFSRDTRLQFSPLFEDVFGLVCHQNHPLAGRESLAWDEIAGLPHIGTVAHRQLEAYAVAAFLRRRDFFVASMSSLVAMVERDMGVTVLARLGVPPGREALAFVPLRSPAVKRKLGIMMLAGATPSPPAQRMLRLLREEIGPQARAMLA